MSQLQVTGEAKIRDIQGPVVANSGVITALDGAASQYVRGDGTLADFPTSSGGGSSVSYYLNSSVSQGTIGGVAYRELNKEPIIGAGTDIAISTTGYVASYLTDANDPDVLSIPGGNFNCEFYFSVSNDTGNPFFYAELYKYDGTTFTLLGSSVGVPEYINQGTIIAPYYFAIPVATAALALTDRLAIRIYVNVDGRTVTLHTENGHLCQVVTTLSKGMVSLNNLTDQSQFLTTGTSGTDFTIASTGDTHTFNLPIASAINTGKLSSTDWSTFNAKQSALSFTAPLVNTSNTISIPVATNLVDGYLDNTDWTTFNNKQNAITLTTTGTSGAATLVGATLNIPQYQGVLTNPVTGTGTTNTLPKFTGTSAIGNSNITDTGSLITLGSNSIISGNVTIPNASYYQSLTSTATAVRMLGINSGNVAYVGAIDAGPVSTIFNASSTSLTASFYTSGTEKLTINSIGSVGIGTTSLTGITLNIAKNLTGATASTQVFAQPIIQSDVTGTAIIYNAFPSTQAAAFTINNLYYYQANQSTIGAASAITTQIGFRVASSLTGATNNFAFRSELAAATNVWNLYMNGTANNYMAGSLGIGTTSFVFGGGTYNLNLTKNITGTVVAGGMNIGSIVNSDVTSAAIGLNVQVTTAAAAFTLNQLRHISVNQTTLGAGSSVSNQYGIYVDQITNGSSNFGFFGNIPAGTNRWNIYMDGTANNYLAGSLGIGTTSVTARNLIVAKSITGATSAYGMFNEGSVQSNVTSNGIYFQTYSTVQNTAFTLTNLVHYNTGSSGSFGSATVSNHVGFWASNAITGGTNNIGFRGELAAATNTWNIYMNGTANNYLAGSLGIGSTSLTGYALAVGKNITGAASSSAIYQNGTVQSDVTTSAYGIRNQLNTAAAAFTLGGYFHYAAQQITIGSTSAITSQYGFLADSSMTGATNNYGFFGNIASGTNRWNLYMAGTAANYMAGKLNIGTTSIDTTTRLHLLDSTNGYVGLRLEGSGQYAGSDWTLYASSFPLSSSNDFFGIYNNSNTDSATIGYKLIVTKQGTAALGTVTPNASAILQTDSTTQGFLPPRMTAAQRAAIASPATGLMVYQTDGTEGVYVFSGGSWKSLTMV